MKRRTSRSDPSVPASGDQRTPPAWALAATMGGFYLVLIVASFFAQPGTPGYGANQSGLIACAVGVALLIPVRVRVWLQHRRVRHIPQPGEYWREGAGGIDLLFLMTALVLVLLVDWKLLPQRGVRIGVAGAIAIGASIVAWFARRARRRKDLGSRTGEDKE